MANTTNLLEALSSYQGDQQSLTHFVEIAKQELGENWTATIYQTLPNLPSGLKEKLDHAFQYHGASLSWAEIQSYLSSASPLDIEAVSDRIEPLAYWLNFFGEPGNAAIQQLKDKLNQEKEAQLLSHTEKSIDPILEEESIQPNPIIKENNALTIEEETPFITDESEPILQEEEEFIAEEKDSYTENDQNDDNDFINNAAEDLSSPNSDENFIPEEEYIEDNNYSDEYSDETQNYPQEEYIEESDDYQQEDYVDENYEYTQDNYSENAYQPIVSNETFNDETDLYNDSQYSAEEYIEDNNYSDEYNNENYEYQQDDYVDENYEYTQEEYIEESDDYQQEDYVDENYEYTQDNYSEEYVSDNETDPLQDIEPSNWRTPVYKQQPAETNEEFMAKKVFHQLDFLTAVRCWINARCISLGNKEIYSYRHYGFLIDVMEEAKKDLKDVLAAPTFYPAIEKVRKDGLIQLQSSLKSLESDLKIAYDNLPSELTDLIADSTNVNDLKKALGSIDTSNKPELLGVAPDGFEMLEDPFDGIHTEKTKITSSQTDQNGIQKKKTFSFNKKNAS